MPSCDAAARPPLTVDALVQAVRSTFRGLPDVRKGGNNQRYTKEDAGLAAFSVFFTQSPSFLDYQTRMQKERGRNNATSLFGVHRLPSDQQIRNLLDPVAPSSLAPLLLEVVETLYQGGALETHRAFTGGFLAALDGTQYFTSEKIACPHCTTRTHADGTVRYTHTAVTPVLLAPGQEAVFPLPPAFVVPQDGHDKQDCELAASGRWLAQWAPRIAPWGITFLGDDLYCHQPFCHQVLAQGCHFLFVCLPPSHATLYEWVADFERVGAISTRVVTRWTGTQHITDTYRYLNDLPLRDGDDARLVGWCELTTTDAAGRVVYRNAWATSHAVTAENVVALVAAGRSRWKIENENNNTLKTKGYHFEHNYGHGQQHLSAVLATLILLAYLMHTVLERVDRRYRAIRAQLPSRRTFFEHLRALLQYLPFDTWEHLFDFMLDALAPAPRKTRARAGTG
jgi:hypothetical protein